MGTEIVLFLLVIYPMIGGVAGYAVGKKNKQMRDYAVQFIVLTEFIFVCLFFVKYASPVLFGNQSKTGVSAIDLEIPGLCGFGLQFSMDGFRALYCMIAATMWLFTTLFSKEYLTHYRNRNRYYLFVLVTLGATIGVFLSADLYTTFIFFEIMSLASYVWVVHDENAKALRAGETYLAIAVMGGLVMLMGLFLLYDAVGTLRIAELYQACAGYENQQRLVAAGLCLLFGFGAKAGAVPLHIWLPKAHPVAPAPASALLSGMLTKTGIFGILILSCQVFLYDGKWGTLILTLGMLTMIIGAVLALLSVDLKRTLACSSVSQIGFIMIGIGMQGLLGSDNALAVRGTLLHMVNHSLIKLVLFMAAGVVYMNVHKLNLNEIRGFGRNKPLLHFVFLMGLLSIGGIPLWSGYVSKTLIHESIVEYMVFLQTGVMRPVLYGAFVMKLVEWLFLLGGAMTVAYMLKLYIAVFVEKNRNPEEQKRFDGMNGIKTGKKRTYMNKVSGCVLTVSGVLLWMMGSFPNAIMDKAADMGQGFMNMTEVSHSVSYFTLENLMGSMISIVLGIIIYGTLVRPFLMKKEDGGSVYVNRWPEEWDLEERVYRPLLLVYLNIGCSTVCRAADRLVDYIIVTFRRSIYRDSRIPHELTEGTELTHVLGTVMDSGRKALNHTVKRKHPIRISYEHKLALLQEELAENNVLIGRTLSFGLFMFGMGLLLTLIYMLWW